MIKVLYPNCAGLDVHKKFVVACRLSGDAAVLRAGPGDPRAGITGGSPLHPHRAGEPGGAE